MPVRTGGRGAMRRALESDTRPAAAIGDGRSWLVEPPLAAAASQPAQAEETEKPGSLLHLKMNRLESSGQTSTHHCSLTSCHERSVPRASLPKASIMTTSEPCAPPSMAARHSFMRGAAMLYGTGAPMFFANVCNCAVVGNLWFCSTYFKKTEWARPSRPSPSPLQAKLAGPEAISDQVFSLLLEEAPWHLGSVAAAQGVVVANQGAVDQVAPVRIVAIEAQFHDRLIILHHLTNGLLSGPAEELSHLLLVGYPEVLKPATWV
eukprot:CAMPEP_0115292876 /NCGR_PEP_ID=MMETSP0270-20121206/65368_1 /TAXON_ID=71861 /ORGANISM="Scrippsiella trochoidea, Strain CCMP3099" /LENGTH=262 /DNA_ID=CAMNT_0002710335 /DNA_START=279 /DNA_END=1067 /DNA_ORIENTATION=+